MDRTEARAGYETKFEHRKLLPDNIRLSVEGYVISYMIVQSKNLLLSVKLSLFIAP